MEWLDACVQSAHVVLKCLFCWPPMAIWDEATKDLRASASTGISIYYLLLLSNLFSLLSPNHSIVWLTVVTSPSDTSVAST